MIRHTPITCNAIAVLASPLLTVSVGAQILEGVFEKNYTLSETVAWGDGMGTSVSAAGDVNQDGFVDVIVGNPRARYAGIDSGSAFVYSGKNGSLLGRFDGRAGDLLGSSVAAAGDIDGDGFADMVIGAPGTAEYRGTAIVFSGRGTVLYRFDGPFSRGAFGHSVAGGVDVNQDGFPDVIVGAPWSDPGGQEIAGSAFVYSGKDGSTLFQFDGSARHDRLGSAVASVGVGGAGDINRDGFPDVIVGAEAGPWVSRPGSAFVYSGRDGTVIWRFREGRGGDFDYFGADVAGAGDVNQDGVPDVIVGATYAASNNASRSGSAWVYSGRDGSVLWRFDGTRSERLGTAVAGAGDVNHDGFPDLLVGAAYAQSGAGGTALLYSGKDGSVLWKFYGTSVNAYLGFSVAGAGDIDQDGFPDVILGAPGREGRNLPGVALVYGFKQALVTYGTALPGSRGVSPVIRIGGDFARIGADFEIELLGGLGVAPGVFAGSTARAQTQFMGLTLHGDYLTPGAFLTWGFMTSGIPGLGGTGAATLEIHIPNNTSLVGLTTYWQGFVMDSRSPAAIGVSHTGGLAVTVIR